MKLAFFLILAQLATPVLVQASQRTPAMTRAQAAPQKPQPSSSPRQESGVKVAPTGDAPRSFVINPNIPETSPSARPLPPQPTTFALKRLGPNRLLISFVATHPQWELNLKAPLIIQLSTEEGIELEPSVITREEWPKDKNSLEINLTGISANQPLTVSGAAAYTICERKTRECRKTRSLFQLN